MKKLILLPIIFLFISCGISNSIPVSIQPITKTLKLQEDKNDFYVKANNWMVSNFTNAKSVIQFSDKEEGIVTGKYLLRSTYEFTTGITATDRDIYAIIKIQLKDNATKITIEPENFNALTSASIRADYQFGEKEVKDQINNLIASFEDFMLNDTSGNW